MALQKASKGGILSTPFKFTQAGDTLKGYYQGQVQKTINGSPVIEHTYKTEAGLFSVLGQSNILQQIKNNNIKPGAYVEIEFSGEMQKLKSGKTMKVYDIAFDSENVDSDAQAPVAEQDDSEEEEELEEAALPPVRKPAIAASTPSSATQARIQALMKQAKKA
jgi:hypothetical protein